MILPMRDAVGFHSRLGTGKNNCTTLCKTSFLKIISQWRALCSKDCFNALFSFYFHLFPPFQRPITTPFPRRTDLSLPCGRRLWLWACATIVIFFCGHHIFIFARERSCAVMGIERISTGNCLVIYSWVFSHCLFTIICLFLSLCPSLSLNININSNVTLCKFVSFYGRY